MSSSTDRIERKVLLSATPARVWRALSNAEEFGTWFGVSLKGETFAPGKSAKGRVTHPGYDHLIWNVVIERMEPERLLSWRWHPHAIEADQDYSNEPTTLVTFELQKTEGGTLLTITESGFDQVPPERRTTAFRGNSEGWDEQTRRIAKHVATP